MTQEKQAVLIKELLINALNEEKETLADEYIRMNEVLKFVYSYFAFNIDEVAGEEIEKLTLSQLGGVLEPRINRYKNYVRANSSGGYKHRNDQAKTADLA
jgi:hypothetical protein